MSSEKEPNLKRKSKQNRKKNGSKQKRKSSGGQISRQKLLFSLHKVKCTSEVGCQLDTVT